MENSLLLSIVAIIISFFTLALQIYKYKEENERFYSSRAPIYAISSLSILSENKMRFPTAYKMPENSEFSIAKRHYYVGDNLKDSVISIIINACPKFSIASKILMINQNRLIINNIGYDSVYLELNSIDIFKKSGEMLHVYAAKQNKLVQKLSTGDPLPIFISMICNSESALYDTILMQNPIFNYDKLSETKGELLNITLEQMAELWEKMEFNIFCKNVYNECYKQKLIIYIENNTYYSDYTEPEKIKLNSKKNIRIG